MKILESEANKSLNQALSLADQIKAKLNDPTNGTKLNAAKIYNDVAGKKIKLAAVSSKIVSEGQRLEDYFD